MDLHLVVLPFVLAFSLASTNQCVSSPGSSIELSLHSLKNASGHWITTVDTRRFTMKENPRELTVNVHQETRSCDSNEIEQLVSVAFVYPSLNDTPMPETTESNAPLSTTPSTRITAAPSTTATTTTPSTRITAAPSTTATTTTPSTRVTAAPSTTATTTTPSTRVTAAPSTTATNSTPATRITAAPSTTATTTTPSTRITAAPSTTATTTTPSTRITAAPSTTATTTTPSTRVTAAPSTTATTTTPSTRVTAAPSTTATTTTPSTRVTAAPSTTATTTTPSTAATTTRTTTITTTPKSCPRAGYRLFPEFNCYKAFPSSDDKKTWGDAREQCRTDGGDLMLIETEREKEDVYIPLYKSVTWSYTEPWVGVYIPQGGDGWMTVKGEPALSTWLKPDYPKKDANSKCARADKNGLLFNWDCAHHRNFICEIPL